jgi:hypothetical protein
LLDVLRWDVAGYGAGARFANSFLAQLGPTECAVFAAEVNVKGGLVRMVQDLWSSRGQRVAFGKAIKEARSSIADAHYMAGPEALARAFD